MGKSIIDASMQVKAKDCPDEDIKKVIAYIFALIGIKPENLPTDFQKAVILNFIRENLGSYSLDEFRIAFHLLAENKLETNGNHYQNFSAIYLGDVMSAYQKVKNTAYKDFRIGELKAQNAEIEQNNTSSKDESIAEFVNDCIVKPYRSFLKTGVLTFGLMPYNIIYRYMTNVLGLIDIPIPIKKEIHAQALKIVQANANKKTHDKTEFNKLKIIRNEIERLGLEKACAHDIKIECYRISIHRYFDQLKTDNVDFESLVNEKLKNL